MLRLLVCWGKLKSEAIIVTTIEDLEKVDFSKSIYIYSQTTKSPKAYNNKLVM